MRQGHATCQITFAGAFDSHLADYLGGLKPFAVVRHGPLCITTLAGDVPDLAAFIGMISMLSDQGIAVVGCEYHRPVSSETPVAGRA